MYRHLTEGACPSSWEASFSVSQETQLRPGVGLNPRTFAHDFACHILPQHTHCLLNCSLPHPCFVTKLERTPLSFKLAVVPSLCSTVTPGSPPPPTPLHHHTVCLYLVCWYNPHVCHNRSNTPVLGHRVQERWRITAGREAETQDSPGPGCQRSELTTHEGSRCVRMP